MTKKNNQDCPCPLCKNKFPFKMPEEIIDSLLNGKLVLFVGSGVSTENATVFPLTLYEYICDELNISNNLSFSKVMSLFCEKKGRKVLLQKIKKRFDYVFSFPQIYNFATRFHQELSTIYLIKDIFTTNWDDFFERECAAIPIVTSEDFAFWDLPGRKVFKIHGSINNIGTLVATEEDYKKCYQNLKSTLLGNYLRMSLATKTIVFIGYSFGDEDFNKLYQLLKSEMKELLPHSYLVTLDKNAIEKFQKMKITPIITDGTYFIHSMKKILIEKEVMIDDHILEKASTLLELVIIIHHKSLNKYNLIEYPNLFYTYMYQDGLIDALSRVKFCKKTGEYSHDCFIYNSIETYEVMLNEKNNNNCYSDVAYIEGYINGLYYLVAEKKEDIPLFYIYGYKEIGSYEAISSEEFEKILENKEVYDENAYKYAQNIVKKRVKGDPETIIHHAPFL